jgi:peroxiredoxin
MKEKLIITLLLVFVLIACKTATKEKLFSLDATLIDIPDSTLFFLKNKANIVLDSAYIINSKLSLKAKLNPKSPEDLILITTSPEFIYTLLLVGNEQITFEAKKTDFPWNIDISGSVYQDQLEIFNQVEYQRQQIKTKFKKRSDLDKKRLSEKMAIVSDSLDKEVVRLIRENFNTYAALSKFKYHKTKFSTQELSSLYSQLDDELKATNYGKAVKLQSEFPKPNIGDNYYNYSALNQKGNKIALSNIKNKHVLLHFSSLACYGSQSSLPELKALRKDYVDELEIVSISVDLNKELWEKHVKRDSIPWNYLWDGRGDYNDAYIKYWEIGTPNYVLISPDKVILERWFGFRNGIFREKLEKYLNN